MSDSHHPFPVSAGCSLPSASSASSAAGHSAAADAKNAILAPTGPRKLIRPTLPASPLPGHLGSQLHNGSEALTALTSRSANFSEDSHAEAFYFQKQIQAQTPMVVVLETGEQIEGTLEWYDHNAIKLRNGQRRHTTIYKAAIKYLYKATENPQHDIMK